MPVRFRNTLFSFGLFCLVIVSGAAFSQGHADQHWFFGNNNIGVEFTRPLNVPELLIDQKLPPFNVRGNATANKPETGDLLFYTDGFNVYDATYGTMDGISLVDKLDADINKNQSVAIASAPGNNDLYYLFTNTPSGAIHLSQVDMTSNGNAIALQPPLGRALSPMNEVIANSTANASDAMLVVPNATNDGYWLISLDQGSNDYKVLGIDSSTPGSWLENTYTLPLSASMDASHIAFNLDSLQIAVAPKSANTNIQILDIDLSTGVLTFNRELANTGNGDFATEAIFDVAWSADGSKLYYSRYGDQAGNIGNLMQVDMGAPPSASPVSVVPATVFGSYGLQLGPDNNLYHLYQETNGGPFLVGRVLSADSVASLTTYEPALENNQDFNSLQFPTFLPQRDPQLSVDFTFAGTCSNAPTAFFPQITPAPTAVNWDFGDGNGSTDLAPFNTYTAGNTYSVTLTAILNGQPMQVTKPVTITDFQLQLTLPQDTVACQCELPKYGPTCTQFSVTVQAQGGSGSETYLWSDGTTTGTTFQPDSAGYYYVVATDGTCSTYAGVYVQEYDTTIPGIAPDQRSNIWYFGQNAGIDFNPTSGPVALTDGAMDAMEGCTAVSDRNGQILFYTDGDVFFDKNHTQIDSGLGGTPDATGPASQSVIGVPVPNDETLFYVFTTQSTDPSSPDYNFSYSLFDLKARGGLGDFIEKNITLFTKSTERLAATPSWVVIHEYGNNNFRAYPITAAGIGNAVVTSIGEDYSLLTADNGKGYMKFSSGATKLAVAVVDNDGTTTNNYLDLFDFDNTTGTVTDFGRADLDADGASGTPYGVEFSPGGNKVYVTVKSGGGSQIMEYRANYVDSMHVYSPIMTDGGELGAIQLGPDGQMYVTSEGVGALGVINVQEDTLQTSTYTANSFNLAGRSGHLGLPNFVQQTGTAGLAPGISVSSPVCVGQPAFLAANLTSSIDSAEWQITDPTGAIVFTSSNLADTVTLNTPGDHIVALLLKNRCLNPINTFSEIITVNPPPQTSDLPLATFLCGTTTTLPVYTAPPANITDLDFVWSTGETTSSIDVTLPGTYTVDITDRTSGCATSAEVFVGPPIPVDLGPDQDICENDALTLDSQVNADTYVWTINGLPQVGGTRFFDFGALALPGGAYTVQVDATIDLGGSIGSCTVIDQAIITVNPSPVFTAVEGAQATCNQSDGSIDLTLTSSGSYTYAITALGISGTISDTDVMPLNIPGVPAGFNSLTITNNVTGCAQTASVPVTNPTTFNISAASPNDETCDLGDGSIDYTVTVTGSLGAFTATAIDINNSSLTYTATGSGSGNFSIPGIPAGDYNLQIQEDGGLQCIATWDGITPITLTIGTPVNSDLQVSQNPVLSCGTSADLSTAVTSLDVTPEWSDDGGATYQPIGTPFTTLGSTTVTVRATATAIPTCEVTQDIEVVVTPTPTFSIDKDESDICNGLVTLSAINENGGYTGAQLGYRWSNGATTHSIVVSQTGTYSLTVYHTINQSCSNTVSENVTIPTPFTVTLSSTLACDDGQPFTLTATPNGQTNNNLNWSWFLNGSELGLTTSSIIGLDEGLYEVVAEDQSGCTANATLQISRIPLTPTNLSSAPVFCPDDGSFTLDAGTGFVSYLWSDGSVDQTLEVTSGGVYSIAATNNFGCVTNDQSEVIEDCIPKISGPNAFRPGGLNSTYSLFTQYVDTFEIFIFDQWGEMVYHSTDKAFAWDGVYNGELLPAGQYSWVVRYTSSFRDRGTIEKYGGVVLIR